MSAVASAPQGPSVSSSGHRTGDPARASRRDPLTVAVLVADGAPVFETAVPLGVFGPDRSAMGVPRFRVLPFAEPGSRRGARMTAGLRVVAPHGVEVVDQAGVVVVPTWRMPPTTPHPRLLQALRRADQEGACVMGLCLGAFVLAAAGLLDGREAATHWLCTDLLANRHPAVGVRPDVLFVDEGNVITSAGSAAGIDACLHLLKREHGASVAATVARRMVVPLQRAGGQAQYILHPVPRGDDEEQTLPRVATWAMEHLAEALDVGDLAARAHLSRRTFDRRFREWTGTSPKQWLLHQRVLRAQQLLEQTDLPIDGVARAVGFSDGVALRPHFRRVSGVPPRAYRETFRGGGPSV